MEKTTSKKTAKTKPTKTTPSVLEQPKTESEFARRERLRLEHRGDGDDFFASFGFKCIIVFALILIFQIPMLFICNLIDDRTTYHREAENSILEPKGGQPELQGVLIAVPCEKTVTTISSYTSTDGRTHTNENKDVSKYYVFITPEQLNISTSVQPEKLQRGIFEVPVFGCDLKINGAYDKIEEETLEEKAENTTCKALWDETLFLVGISNKKILTTLPEIKIGEKTLTQSLYEPTIGSPFDNTIYYDLGAVAEDAFEFTMIANVQGGQILALTPIATENKFNIDSIWKNPSFGGGWLPTTRNLNQSGFEAEWKIPGLSTKFPNRWSWSARNSNSNQTVQSPSHDDYKDAYSKSKGRKYEQSISVSFYQPVDNYQKATRSTKYSILFLLIPFIALLIFEIFSKVKIHPIQYVLIGLANVVFYLLLLSISEHISFNATYWISCIAVSVLILFYGVSILRKFSSGALFAAINFVSYIFLFGTLQAEDYALLIGSIGIFFVVAALMILTRKIDWYKLKDLYNNK